jgi:hypothetical protein
MLDQLPPPNVQMFVAFDELSSPRSSPRSTAICRSARMPPTYKCPWRHRQDQPRGGTSGARHSSWDTTGRVLVVMAYFSPRAGRFAGLSPHG